MDNLEQQVTLASTGSVEQRHRAFTALVHRFQDMACAWAYARLGNFTLAEDAAQEAFVAAYRALPDLRQPAAFPGWLRRIVTRQCDRFTRAERLPFVALDQASALADPQPDPGAASEARELASQVQAALADLPDKERQVTTLFYISGYSMKEVSAFLDLPESTVTNRLRNARKRLKERLLDMVKDYLPTERPSRDAHFADAIRTAVEQDWEPLLDLAHDIVPFDREGNEEWLKIRRQFDAKNRTRRHYVATHPDDGRILGYGCIEQQDPDPQRFRLYIVVPPDLLAQGLGDLLYNRLLADLKELKAQKVWIREAASQWPPPAPEKDLLEFFEQRGFVRDRLIWRMVLPLDEVNWEQLNQTREAVKAADIRLSTLAAEMERDQTALQKFTDLANISQAHMARMRCAPIAPVTLKEIEQALAKSTLLPIGSTNFIAAHNDGFATAVWLRNLDEEEGQIEAGIPFMHPQNHTPEITTALHLAALEWARDHNLKSVHSFVDDRDTNIMAACEASGFQRRLVMPIMEMELPN